jgi:hypothetical protein
MEASVECTHCGVLMTPWSAPGSTIRYYQCPFCARTHSSLYGEVFRRRAGARVLDAPPLPAAAAAAVPTASQEDVRWARVKASAARWFARLEEDERRLGPRVVARPLRPAAPVPRAVARPVRAAGGAAVVRAAPRAAEPADGVPEVDPADVIEIAPVASGRRR